MKAAYNLAKAGGKHSGFLRVYAKKSANNIHKAIRSLERNVKQHESKIANPEQWYPDRRKLRPEEQKANLEKIWPKTIQAGKEQIEILKEILENR